MKKENSLGNVNPTFVKKHKVYTLRWDTNADEYEPRVNVYEPVYLDDEVLSDTIYIDSSYVLQDDNPDITVEEQEKYPVGISYSLEGAESITEALTVEAGTEGPFNMSLTITYDPEKMGDVSGVRRVNLHKTDEYSYNEVNDILDNKKVWAVSLDLKQKEGDAVIKVPVYIKPKLTIHPVQEVTVEPWDNEVDVSDIVNKLLGNDDVPPEFKLEDGAEVVFNEKYNVYNIKLPGTDNNRKHDEGYEPIIYETAIVSDTDYIPFKITWKGQYPSIRKLIYVDKLEEDPNYDGEEWEEVYDRRGIGFSGNRYLTDDQDPDPDNYEFYVYKQVGSTVETVWNFEDETSWSVFRAIVPLEYEVRDDKLQLYNVIVKALGGTEYKIPADLFKYARNVRYLYNTFLNYMSTGTSAGQTIVEYSPYYLKQNEEEGLGDIEPITLVIPEDLFVGCPNIEEFWKESSDTYIYGPFCMCYNLVEIPEGLFRNNRNVTNFDMAFIECASLKSIPEKLFENNTAVTNFTYTFSSCTSLTSIPEKLFENNTAVTNFTYTFSSCTSLTSIPEKLFENNTAVTYFSDTFSGCESLESIPEKLFENNTAVTYFSDTFSGCESLESIPEKLFENNTAVTDFYDTFGGCKSLESIPEKLFENNTAVTSFNSTFVGCESLESIPEGLFRNNIAVIDFDSTFRNCESLESIPAKLFENNAAVTNFGSTFNRCINLKSIPAGLFKNNTVVINFGNEGYDGIFSRCTSLNNIPEDLFENNTAVTDFYGSFSKCTGLESIPEGLFNNNTAVTNFSDAFNGCTSLTSIPEKLFENNTAVTSFSGTFSDCTSLTSIPEGLFNNNTAVTNFSDAFSGCTSLTSIPEKLFENNTAVTNFKYTFQKCINLTGSTPTTTTKDGNKYKLWELAGKPGYPRVIDGYYCFCDCKKLDEWTKISFDWKCY